MKVAQVFRALGDEVRIELVRFISTKGEATGVEIIKGLSLTQPTASHHLQILISAGVVERSKSGKWRKYRLSDSATVKTLVSLIGDE